MNTLRRLLRVRSLPLFVAQIVSQLVVLLRNIVIVRALTKTDYGIAMTFVFAIAIVRASADLNIGHLLIQAPDGENPRLQRTAHLVRVLQGLVIASAIFLLAPLMAQLFSAPDALSSYYWLAVIPLATGLGHFDMLRYQRAGRFGPSSVMNAGGQVFSLVVVIVAAQFVTDYRLVVVSMFAIAAGTAGISHLLAERSYRWSIDRDYTRRILHYGWPLIVNGIFMVAIAQGDRALLGSAETLSQMGREWLESVWGVVAAFDKADLAVYSIGLSLTQMPTQFLVRTLGMVLLPMMSQVNQQRDLLRDAYASSSLVFSVFATIVAALFILGGGPVAALVYSERYRAVETVIGLLAIAQALRTLRLPAVTLALALARTKIPLYANIARALSLVGTAVVVLGHWGLPWVAATAALGEALGLFVVLWFARGRFGFGVRPVLPAVAFMTVGCGLAFLLREVTLPIGDLWRIAVAGFYALGTAGLACVLMPGFLPGLKDLLAARQRTRAAPTVESE